MVKDQRGQSLVEFALVLPILLLLIAGIIDFGRVSYTYMNVNLTTQETVRQAGIGKKDAEIIQFAKNHFKSSDSSSLQIDINPKEANRESGKYVTVTLQYPVTYITPLLSKVLPSPYTVSANSTVRVE